MSLLVPVLAGPAPAGGDALSEPSEFYFGHQINPSPSSSWWVVRSLVLFSRTVRGEYPAWLAWKVLDTLVYIIITAICRRAAAGNAAAKKVDAVLRFLGWVCDDIEP